MKLLTTSVLSIGLAIGLSTSAFAFGGCSGAHKQQTVAQDQTAPAQTVATQSAKKNDLKDLVAQVTKQPKTTNVAAATKK
jgi:hypothetical protein